MKKNKLIFTLTVFVLLCIMFCFPASANFNGESELSSKLLSYSYYMVSLDDETEMFSKNKDKKVSPAAFNKLAAAVVAVEEWDGDLDKKVKVTKQALSFLPNEYGVTVAGISEGESYTRRQLLECMMIHSSNDCESVIAHSIAGTKEGFVKMMQNLVERIGCKNTKIVDMFGFDSDGQYTTAYDVSILIRHALQYPEFSEPFSKNSVTLKIGGEEQTLIGSNRMTVASIADYYTSTVTGGKQTSTKKAGECIAVKSESNGYSYLTVVMKGSLKDIDGDGTDENTSMTDAKKMIEWVNSNIRFKTVATPGQTIYVVDVDAGKDADTLNLTAEKEISVLAPVKASGDSVLIEPIADTVPEKVKAPITAGQIICKAKVLYANEEIAQINLVASQDIKRSIPGYLIMLLSTLITSKGFIAAEIILLCFLIIYLVIKIHGILTGKKPKLWVVGQSKKKKTSKASQPRKKNTANTNVSPARQRRQSTSTAQSRSAQKTRDTLRPSERRANAVHSQYSQSQRQTTKANIRSESQKREHLSRK